MKRQTDTSVVSRVYVYGCVPARIAPVIGEPAALDQMRLAGRLWNVLVRIDHIRQERYKTVMHDDVQEQIDVLRRKKEALVEEIKARRKAARKRKVDIEDLLAPLQAAKLEIATLVAQQKKNSKERHEAKESQLTALQELCYRRIKRARQAAASMGLFWGTYNDIIQRADAGRKHGGELHFRGFHGEGTLTAQIMGGAAVERCVGGDHTFFEIDGPTPGRKWRYARMRIGAQDRRNSGGGKMDPVWVEIPIVYHRDLPAHADIRSVGVTRRILDGKVAWQLNVTVNTARPAQKHAGRAVGIDVGWRKLARGVRVAYWYDDQDRQGQVIISPEDIGQFEKVSALRGICDRSRDQFLPVLAEWIKGITTLSEEWQKRSAHLALWRSPDRLERLVAWWRDHRIDGDAEIYEGAVTWRKQYLHLAHWWRNLHPQMVARVKEQYRLFAAQAAARYGAVYIEDFDLREVVRKPKAEDEKGKETAGSHYRQMVSPSEFRRALVIALGRQGVRVVKLPAADTTRRHWKCGHPLTGNAAQDITLHCPQCSEDIDQDQNAARNLLQMGLRSAVNARAGA